MTAPGLLQAPRWIWLSELRAHVLRGSVPGLRTGPSPQQVLRKHVDCMAQGLPQANDRSTSREMLGIYLLKGMAAPLQPPLTQLLQGW